MGRINRDGVALRWSILVVVLGVAFVSAWAAAGLSSGALSAVAIGAGVGVALFGGNRRTCAPGLLRRRG
ncbi:MAG TPA: hypothetical protein VFA66_09300 [Gaiellaceae bacterium]|nr:hypothetical protein [Gaiellaceae bacterium]